MRFEDLLQLVAEEPLFESGLLLAGDTDPAAVQRQLSRWTEAGRLIQLRRGLYALASPFRKIEPHPFLTANRLSPGSYVSLQAALAHYGLIPEAVPVTTSVGSGRPARWDTPLGSFLLRHLQAEAMAGFRELALPGNQVAWVASPEKALLDLVYLEPGGDSSDYLQGLRLQNLDGLDGEALFRLAESLAKPKIRRAAERIADLVAAEALEYQPL